MEPGAPAAVTPGASSLSETMWQHVRARPWITACWLMLAPRTSTWQCSTVMLGEVRLSPVPGFGKFFPVQALTVWLRIPPHVQLQLQITWSIGGRGSHCVI